jgi:hypothetical protein
MEQIPGSTPLPRVGNLPLPYADAVAIALKIAQAAEASCTVAVARPARTREVSSAEAAQIRA